MILLAVVQMVFDPILVLCNFLITISWISVYSLYYHGLSLNGKKVDGMYITCFGIFLHLLFLSLFHRLLQFVCIILLCLFSILLHAALRKRSLRSKIALRTLKLPFQLDSLLVSESDVAPLVIPNDASQPPGVNNRVRGILERSPPFSGDDTESD